MNVPFPTLDDLRRRIERLEEQLALFNESSIASRFYSVAQFAEKVGRSNYTVREWARLGRIYASRRATARGPYREWVISHRELLRYQQQGLLPLSESSGLRGDE